MASDTNCSISLCAPILGLGGDGYAACKQQNLNLPYRSPTLFSDIKKFAQVAIECAAYPYNANPLSYNPQPVSDRAYLFKIEEGKICQGQGEYILFHAMPNKTQHAPRRQVFDLAYSIFNQYAPAAIINRDPPSVAMGHCLNRYEMIKSKVKQIDTTLEVGFVPRTLYELTLIRKCIQEDLKNGSICELSTVNSHKPHMSKHQEEWPTYIQEAVAKRRKQKCWHLCYFENIGNNNHFGVKDIAYRLNRSLVKNLRPTASGFTYSELAAFTEKEIMFFHFYTHLPKFLYTLPPIMNSASKTVTVSFFGESLAIQKETDAQIIREAVALECCTAARGHFFIYRGATLQHEYLEKDDRPHSLSYGSGLFAGSMYDTGATSMQYMKEKSDAYAMVVPFDQLHNSPFFIPSTNSIAQLFGNGEFFHARTKVWKGADIRTASGICWFTANKDTPTHLESHLTKEQLMARFECYRNDAIRLRHPKCLKKPKRALSKL